MSRARLSTKKDGGGHSCYAVLSKFCNFIHLKNIYLHDVKTIIRMPKRMEPDRVKKKLNLALLSEGLTFSLHS